MKRMPLIFCFMLLFPFAGYSDDTPKSVFEERIEILKWGIDSQIIDLLSVLSAEKDSAYNDIVFKTLSETRNPEIQEKIIYYLMDMKYEPLVHFTRPYCRYPLDDMDYDKKVLFASIASLGHLKDSESAPILYDLFFMDIDGVTGPVSRALSSLKNDSGAERMLRHLEELDLTDKLDTVPGEIILFLGEIAYNPAVSFLLGVVESEENYSINRNYACIALGQIGDPESIEVLQNVYYNSKDSILRSYALAGLGYFDTPETERILTDALKRDSFWKVRVSAAEKIGERNITSAVDLLIYKAEKDPVDQVKMASMKALGRIGSPAGLDFLAKLFGDSKKSETLRLEAFKILLEKKDSRIVPYIQTVFEKEWESKTSRLVEFVCRELSLTEWPMMGEFYRKMLLHKNPVIKTYGIRGIRRNSLLVLYPEAKALDREGESGMVRKEAAMIP